MNENCILPINATMFLFLKKYCIAIIGLVFSLTCIGQNNNIWYFGNGGGVNFNTSPPKSFSTNISTSEGCSSVSDDDGRLLFYTDGITVWNRFNAVMDNGKSLAGHTSTTQSSLVVKKPGKDSIYYIFNADLFHTQASKGVFYSIVDMSADGGLGDVISKNNLLYDKKSTEKIAVVKASSYCGFWIITHDANSSKFYTYFLGANGVDQSPVVSDVGYDYSTDPFSSVGYLAASPDGTKLAAALFPSHGIEVYDFDKKTGKITNSYFLENSKWQTYYGVCFSPSSKYLYYANLYGRTIFRHNVSLSNITKIRESKTQVAKQLPGDVGALQLAPNGKIYVVYNEKKFLGAVDNPEEKDVMNLVYNLNGISLKGKGVLGLPSFVNSTNFSFSSKLTLGTDTLVCSNQHTITSNKPTEKHLWSTGDTLPKITINKNGKYWVEIAEKCGNQSDTLSVIVVPDTLPQLNLGNDTATCDTVFKINTEVLPNVKYLWSTHDTAPYITVKKDSNYTLTMYNVCYTRTDDINVNFKYDTINAIKIADDILTCEENYKLSIPEFEGAKYLWSTGDTLRELVVGESGMYWGRLTAPICNANYFDTVKVEIFPTVPLDIGNDIEGCENDYINKQLTANAKYISYLWSDGSTSPNTTIKEGGIYTLSVTDTCGSNFSKSINVNLCPCYPYVPTSFTPNGDGANDYFSIESSCALSFFDLKIFTRWGELIFQSNNPNINWDGLYKGNTVPSGTYIVSLRYGYQGAKTRNSDYKGFIQLLR